MYNVLPFCRTGILPVAEAVVVECYKGQHALTRARCPCYDKMPVHPKLSERERARGALRSRVIEPKDNPSSPGVIHLVLGKAAVAVAANNPAPKGDGAAVVGIGDNFP